MWHRVGGQWCGRWHSGPPDWFVLPLRPAGYSGSYQEFSRSGRTSERPTKPDWRRAELAPYSSTAATAAQQTSAQPAFLFLNISTCYSSHKETSQASRAEPIQVPDSNADPQRAAPARNHPDWTKGHRYRDPFKTTADPTTAKAPTGSHVTPPPSAHGDVPASPTTGPPPGQRWEELFQPGKQVKKVLSCLKCRRQGFSGSGAIKWKCQFWVSNVWTVSSYYFDA